MAEKGEKILSSEIQEGEFYWYIDNDNNTERIVRLNYDGTFTVMESIAVDHANEMAKDIDFNIGVFDNNPIKGLFKIK